MATITSSRFAPSPSRFDDLVSSIQLPDPLGFGQLMAPVMIVSTYRDGVWEAPRLERLDELPLAPHTQALHYGQAVFEGMKAYRNLGDGFSGCSALLFRPHAHAKRFNMSAARLGMPCVEDNMFVAALELLVATLVPMIPDSRGQSLYLRPFMFGSTASLSVTPSTEYSFAVVAAPSDAFFTTPISAWIERKYSRAGPGGTGAIKAAGNYAASFAAAAALKENGFQQLLWLDAVERTYLEEFTAMNVMVRMGDRVSTPPLSDTILAGITRDSLMALAPRLDIEMIDEPIDVNVLLAAIEAEEDVEIFGCGTGAVVAPIEMIGDETGMRLTLKDFTFARRLRELLLDIQHGIEPDGNAWQWPVPESPRVTF